MALWAAIGHQLRNPHGLGGRWTGRFMRVVNRVPNELAVDALRLTSLDVALDLGCGPGQAIALMAERAWMVHGLDQSSTMLTQARQANLKSIARGRVILRRGTFDKLPYANASMDKILASNVMYFWPDIPAVLQEMRRVLRPGGRIVVYVTDEQSMRKWKFARSDTHRLFDAAGLEAALRHAPFEDSDVHVQQLTLSAGIRGLLATIAVPNLQSLP